MIVVFLSPAANDRPCANSLTYRTASVPRKGASHPSDFAAYPPTFALRCARAAGREVPPSRFALARARFRPCAFTVIDAGINQDPAATRRNKMTTRYNVCSVSQERGKSYWTTVGVAFPLRKGPGFSIILNAVPPASYGKVKLILLPQKSTSAQGEPQVTDEI